MSKKMKKMKQIKRIISVSMLSAMLLNTALPSSLAHVFAAENPSKQYASSGTFTVDEVNRILAGLTPEQKASINKLTGADIAQKIHVEQKDLSKSSNIQVIVQFKTDPAKIQIIKDSLEKGAATADAQAFTSEFAAAEQQVKDSHTTFQSFVDKQAKTQIIGGKTVNTKMSITRQYTDAFNGVALSLPGNQVAKLAENPEIASVWPIVEYTASESGDTSQTSVPGSVGKPTGGLTLMGVDKLQAEGHTGIIKTGPRAGQKVKVGVLDTGIDYNHPDLYKVTHDESGNLYGGHDHVNSTTDAQGNIKYIDDLDPMETIYPDWLEQKANPNPAYGPAPADYKSYITSHGTHVAGTIAANTTNNNGVFSANGMAPDVELHGYRVLGPGGHGTSESVLNGIDQSVKDQMDVINLSLGATTNDPLYPTSIAINNATLAGVVCSISAGNSGPGVATVGSPGTSPLAITVGASSIPVEIPVMTIKNGNTSYQARLFGKTFADADDALKGQTLPIVDVGLGSEADYQGKDVKGKIVLVHRGGEFLQTKMANAYNAGVKAMIIWDNQDDTETQGYIPSFLGVKQDNVYSISLTQAQGQALSNAIKADPNTATVTFPMTLDASIKKAGDELASFSSTGPVKDWTIKPDVVAPGVDIMSTAPYDIWESQDKTTHNYQYAYQSMSGTSMAAPHTTGAIALVLAANPDYTPADVKTALMSTAKDINTDSKTHSVYQVGAGRIDPERAIKSDVKVQVLDKATTVDTVDGSDVLKQIDHITGSMFFGYKGRGDGATNGTDDVVSSKDFNVVNQGNSSKTFNVSTQFISTKFALSNKVGPGTGNDVTVDFSVGGSKVTSINVGGNSTAKTTATITVPSNALDGTYEGYINVVNAADASETYRIPFTITVAEKGIDSFNVVIKAAALGGLSAYKFSVNNEMENFYIVLKDKDGKYIGITNTLINGSYFTPGVHYGPMITLFNGLYIPFTKDYDGTYDPSWKSSPLAVLPEGSYSLEMIATDKEGKHYTAEDSVYVDGTPPTMTMDNDSKGGIYEIDPTGYLPGQEIKGFYGTVYDSNVDVMKNNGEASVPSPRDGVTPVPVDQGLNSVVGYQDSMFPTVFFNTDAKGRFHFGITPEDVANKFGSEFIINPVDYSGSQDYDTKKQTYYFIKKGNPYVTITSSNGVDAGPGNEDKVVVDANKPFKATIATHYGIGMTSATITLNNSKVYSFSNIRLTDEYKNYLISKGVDLNNVVLTVSQPYVHPVYQVGQNLDVTISGIGAAGALDHDMNIIEADVTYVSPDPITGPVDFRLLKANLTLSGVDTLVAWFPTNTPYLRQFNSLLRGRVAAESFARNTINNNYPQFTVDSGAKVTVKNDLGKTFTTDNPTSENNTIAYQFINPYYAVTMDVSDKPYSVEASVPGHFKGYGQTPVIGENKFGYQSATVKDLPGLFPILLGGDVNGDNVIDMKDLTDEINVYYQYKNLNNFNNPLNTVPNKTAFLNTNRNADIYWIKPTGFGYGIDYNDFYFIFKNFGVKNQSAIDAGLTVPPAQMTVDQDMSITTQYGGSITLNAGDTLQQVMQKLNFAAPAQAIASTPKLQDLQNGATISLSPTSPVFVDDVVWRKAITKIMIGSTDVTDQVTIAPAYTYFDANGAKQTMQSKITFPGSLFPTATSYTMTVKATGYQDVVKTFTISAVPIPTPVVPIITDPAVAHIGQDLTLTFSEDAIWRNGINKVIVTTTNGKSADITTLINPDTNQKYYDISQPGKITLNAKTFMTNSTLNPNTGSSYVNATVNPGGTSYLPQLYKITIGSNGNGNVYPDVIAGYDPVYTGQQPVGYSVTFNSLGGSTINSMAVGFRAGSSRSNGPSSDLISAKTPAPTRTGYKFLGWYNEPAGITPWDVAAVLTADKTVYAKWQMNTTQNYSPVDSSEPNGLKFDGSNGGVTGKGWVLGEGDLNITIPDYLTNVSWLTGKEKISKIEASFYQMKSDGSTDTIATTYTLDPSTYNLVPGTNNSGVLSFTTATHNQAVQAGQTTLGEKFAFSEMPTLANVGGINGYKVTLTATTGETVTIPDISLGYRRHIDLNGGTLKNANDLFLADQLVNTKASAPTMSMVPSHVTKGDLTPGPYLYLDAAGSSDKRSSITDAPIFLTDNATYYLGWTKVPPAVSKDTVGNIVGSDITLTFNDDGTWKNNIKAVQIGSKILVANTDYTMTENSIILNHNLFTNGQKVNVMIVSEGYKDVVVTDQVIGYTVTFESNGGDPVPAQIVDRSATKPIDPAKVGFKFYGWYSDQNLTTPYDFSSIVTKPIKLYAKYALAGSVVTPDTTDYALGNNIELEFSDSDWAKAISNITINGIEVDQAKYSVDTVNRTITLDKSLFTRARDYMILIKATDYADVTLVQKVANGYKVHFVVQDNAPFAVQDKIVVRRITEPVVYGYDLTWFADEACTLPWEFTNSIYSDRTLYGKWTPHKFSVVFDHQDGSLVDSKTGDYSKTITAPTTPTRADYAFLGWYKDTAGKTAWNFATDKVSGDTILYAKWATGVENNGIYNKDVTISFNEATATLDGQAYTSGTKVTSEGNHTLVVTDVAGIATTIKFTIDKTAPIVSGVINNGIYNHVVTLLFNETNALLNGDQIGSDYAVTKEGNYTLVVTDQAGNATTVQFTIDKTAPVVTGVNNNGLYNNDVTVNFNEGTATLNGDDITNGTVISEEGTYLLIVTDQAGNVTKVKFTIDKTAPIVTGVSDNGIYRHDLTVKFNEGTATLNGDAFTNGTVISNEGAYTLVVADKTGNETSVTFTIDKTAPTVTNVSNNGIYNHNVTVSFNEGTATLNGDEITSGTVVSNEGIYSLIVTDKAGNTTIVKFRIDKTAPVVSSVSNNGLYNHNVTLSFNELGALLNGKPIANRTVVSKNGNYTLVVTDQAGNKTTVKFTIDKTAPTAPKVNKVTAKTTKVTGKAEAGSTVVIKVGTKVIGTATADKYGNYAVSIAKQKAGTILYVTAKDKAGNVSKATKVSVSK